MTAFSQLRRRHLELVSLAVGLLLLAAVTTVVLALDRGEWLLAAALAVLSVLFCGYVIDAELKIRALNQQLLNEEFSYLEAQARESILNSKIKELTALRTALEALAMERRPEKALETILSQACSLCGVSRGSIMLIDRQSQRFVIAAARGLKPEYQSQAQRVSDSVAGQVVASGQPLLITGDMKVSNITNFISKEAVLRASLCLPLRINGEVIGVLNCSAVGAQDRMFTEYDLQLMSLFAHYAELALERAQAGAPRVRIHSGS
ncbi:MAG: GAF domain-containing protein [Nitrospirota bacterium]